jgi:hypothetical protein
VQISAATQIKSKQYLYHFTSTVGVEAFQIRLKYGKPNLGGVKFNISTNIIATGDYIYDMIHLIAFGYIY